MTHEQLPNEEEALEQTRADEYESRLDELEDELPAFERELERIEKKRREERRMSDETADSEGRPDDHLPRMFELSSKGSELSDRVIETSLKNRQIADGLYGCVSAKTTFTDEEKDWLTAHIANYDPAAVREEIKRLREQCQLTVAALALIDPTDPQRAGILDGQADKLRAAETTTRTCASYIRTHS